MMARLQWYLDSLYPHKLKKVGKVGNFLYPRMPCFFCFVFVLFFHNIFLDITSKCQTVSIQNMPNF